ncbi:hypothetical protein J40TS1_03800 [Paenibacillus montaniterrae]|uniref:Uncharacterized protein n=1 Tax=Paenibacillus montaniterrae TaxID=429341 RepID=A0A920CWY4_9BACL|nr:hypothetical protein J40TS1_03800 [Paenibacillus montaniterrae]
MTSQTIEGAIEKPSKAPAVRRQLSSVILPVPKRWIKEPLTKLETIVPPAIIIEISPAEPIDAPISGHMTGHADPSKESGSPKLINAK